MIEPGRVIGIAQEGRGMRGSETVIGVDDTWSASKRRRWKFFRRVFGLLTLSPTVLRHELGIQSLRVRRRLLVVRYWNRLVTWCDENPDANPAAWVFMHCHALQKTGKLHPHSWLEAVRRVFVELGLLSFFPKQLEPEANSQKRPIPLHPFP